MVIDAEGLTCALRVDQVDHVVSLHESEGEASMVDASGRELILLDPAKLVRRAVELVSGPA